MSTKTFILADRNDAGPVFALATFAAAFLDSFDRYSVECLRECVAAQRVRPEDTGSHPYDGAAFDVFWALFDALDCVPGIDVCEDEGVIGFTATIQART